MATIRPTTPVLPINPDNNSPNTVFDYPDADIVLRSRDEQEFRVLKLYIIHSSPVLSKRIQDISCPAMSSGAKASLPVVQLPDNGDVLSTLLTFIFPVPPVLPSTLEKIMVLLSVAQTYDMVSVLVHIRGSIALREPPIICQENAFYAYSLARKHGLREEAAQAAKISLAFNLIIENLEARSDIPQGVYLHELWQYHQNVRNNLLSGVDNFRGSAAGGTITGLTCIVLTNWGTPNWLDSYIVSIARTPSCFNSVDFQTTLACHVGEVAQFPGNGCSCTNIPGQTMHKFWTALTNFVNENIAKASGINMDFGNPLTSTLYTQAESLLSIPGLGCEAHAQDHACPPAIPPLPESIYVNEADLIIQSSDFVKFRIHKSMLAFSSQVFRDIFSLPQPSNEIVDGLPVLRLSEDAESVRALITVLYPIPSELPATYDRVLSLLAAAQKYDMPAAQSSIRAEVSHRKLTAQTGDQAFHAFAIASRNRLSPETSTAAHLTLDYSMTLENIGSGLRLFEGWALRSLTIFRRCRRDDMLSCLESFLGGRNGPSKIWFGCPEVTQANSRVGVFFFGDSADNSQSLLPRWLSKLFAELFAELKQMFTNPLMQPSSLRKKYLAALGSHTVRTGSYNPAKACEFCFEVHVRRGEEYCTELERNLTLARDKASSAFTL